MAVDTFESPLAASDRWRGFVAAHPWGSAAIAGLVGTQMATLVGYYFIGVGLPQLPWPLYNGVLVIFNKDFSEFATASTYFAGQSIHMVDGVVFTILYAATLYGRFPGPDSPTGDLIKGLTFSVILGLISMGFLVPYVYAPKTGLGLFSFEGPDTWKLPLAILVWHLAYGFFLGQLYSPARRRAAAAADTATA
jgi:hypothetical protein